MDDTRFKRFFASLLTILGIVVVLFACIAFMSDGPVLGMTVTKWESIVPFAGRYRISAFGRKFDQSQLSYVVRTARRAPTVRRTDGSPVLPEIFPTTPAVPALPLRYIPDSVSGHSTAYAIRSAPGESKAVETRIPRPDQARVMWFFSADSCSSQRIGPVEKSRLIALLSVGYQ